MPRPNTPDDFWRRVLKTDGCWLWTGCRDKRGYGKTSIHGKTVIAHRLAWILTFGEIASGQFICHRCDNPPCVNPEHLFSGTPKANMEDMVKKSRHFSKTKPERYARGESHGRHTKPHATARGDSNGSRKHPETIRRGEQVNGVKLTAEKVSEIRQSSESDAAMALRLRVSIQSVWNARTKKTWKHI